MQKLPWREARGIVFGLVIAGATILGLAFGQQRAAAQRAGEHDMSQHPLPVGVLELTHVDVAPPCPWGYAWEPLAEACVQDLVIACQPGGADVLVRLVSVDDQGQRTVLGVVAVPRCEAGP